MLCWEEGLPFIRGGGLGWGTPLSCFSKTGKAPSILILPAGSSGWQQTKERHMFGGKRGNNQV